jgi:hypothetical protein
MTDDKSKLNEELPTNHHIDDEHMAQYREAAEQGDAEAQYQLGLGYVTSLDFEPNPVEALNWWRKAAAQQHPESLFTLGMWYMWRHLPGGNEAVSFHKYVLEHWSKNARSYFGVTSLFELEIPQDDKDAATWLYRAAELRQIGAQLLLGWMHITGRRTLQNHTEAVTWFHKAAEQGDAEVQFKLGQVYSRIFAIPREERFKYKAEAAKLYRKAAEQGHIEAQHQLGAAYRYGLGVHTDPTEANAWFLKAAEQGHVRSMMSLGWVREVAERGYAYAQYRLGEMYAQGDGVPQDATEAMAWYLKAANNTNSDETVESDTPSGQAAYAIASMYADGKGVPKDDATALAWTFKAAEKGSAVAPYEIANRYARGIGVTKDTAIAAEWYCEAESRDSDFEFECFEDLPETCEKRGIPLEEMIAAYRKAEEKGCDVWQMALAYMYQHGFGVPKDKAQADVWNRKAAEQGEPGVLD